jgi:hypothetical protein
VPSVPLTAAQAAAIAHVQALAERDRDAATERAVKVLARAGVKLGLGELCARIAERGRVVCNFHPDRIAADGRTVLEALLEDGVYRNQFETGISNGGLGAVRERFEELLEGTNAPSQPGRALDDYIEAQVHGQLRLADEVEALVADPSFRGTAIGAQLEEIARRFRFALYWHRGFVLDADEVPEHFRGPQVKALGRRVATELGDGTGRIDAEVLGKAARRVVADPDHFADHGTPTETLQHLKQLWHVLVAYGHPAG